MITFPNVCLVFKMIHGIAPPPQIIFLINNGTNNKVDKGQQRAILHPTSVKLFLDNELFPMIQ